MVMFSKEIRSQWTTLYPSLQVAVLTTRRRVVVGVKVSTRKIAEGVAPRVHLEVRAAVIATRNRKREMKVRAEFHDNDDLAKECGSTLLKNKQLLAYCVI